jgi:hypothetical protein
MMTLKKHTTVWPVRTGSGFTQEYKSRNTSLHSYAENYAAF